MYQPQSLLLYIKVLFKIHTPENHVRPTVNWNKAPAYKLAEFMTYKLTQFNINDTRQQIQNLEDIPIAPDKRLIPLHRNFLVYLTQLCLFKTVVVVVEVVVALVVVVVVVVVTTKKCTHTTR